MKFKTRLFALTLTFLLQSCGGSSGGGSGDSVAADDPVNPSTNTGSSGTDNPDTDGNQTDVMDTDGNGIGDLVPDECSVAGLNQWVDDNMRDYYLFYDQVPIVNLADYESPESLIRDLRVQPFDQFSFVNDIESDNQTSVEGRDFGFGYRWRRDDDGLARIARVYRESPMGVAGVRRGDIIVSINGIAWDDIDGELFRELVGSGDSPLPATWRFVDGRDASIKDLDITAGLYSLNTVLFSQTITNPSYDGLMGYLAFDRFLETSDEELDEVMAFFSENEVTDLILDLRYNGGGRTRIARQLASQIAGPATDGELLIQYRYNDRYTNSNFERFFENEEQNLGLNRVVILTTGSTASSSEIVINSLRPYIEVITIGERTVGKPYITVGEDQCGKRMHALEAEGFNASNVSVFGGIAPSCLGTDDLTQDFGVSSEFGIEGMLRDAADFIVFGRCDTPILADSARAAARTADESLKQDRAYGGAMEVLSDIR